MAEPTILRGSDHFFTNLYEGNGGGQRVGNFVPFTDNGTIAKSCIFNDDDTPRLYRQISAGNRKTYTISLWFKLGKTTSTDGAAFWSTSPSNDSGYGGNPSPYNMQFFQFVSGALEIQDYNVSGNHYVFRKRTNRTFEDTSKFYHLLMAVDTTQSTAADRVKLYIDGDQITSFNDINSSFGYPDEDEDTSANQNTYYDVINIGYDSHWDGYMAEFNFVDGSALTPSTFGLTDTSTGRWIPKSLTGITYGTNGYRLTFANSAGQTIGDDTSGNTNDFTVTNLAASDITTDSPTQNHATLSPLRTAGSLSLSEGNLKITGTSGSAYGKAATEKEFPSDISTGLYWEYTDCANGFEGGVIKATKGKPQSSAGETDGIIIQRRGSGGGNTYWVQKDDSGSIYNDTGVSASDGQTIGVAVKSGKIWFAINNTWVLSGDPAAGTNPAGGLDPADYIAMLSVYGTVNMTANFGQKSFQYTPPTGFVAYQQDNFPETGKGITGLTWIKDRDNTYSHGLRDSTRGRHKDIFTNLTQAEVTNTDGVQKFLKGGIQIEDLTGLNASGASIVSWNWVANGGTTTANTDGSGATIASTTQANQTAGFSIIKYTGTGSNGTVAHGLSQAPEWVVVKNLDNGSEGWSNYHVGMTNATKIMTWNNTNAQADSASDWNSTAPTNKVVYVGTNARTNNNTQEHIMYAWNSVEGYSKFGSYSGNGNTDGQFIYTGFKPAWLMIKSSSNAVSWYIFDNKRNPINPAGKRVVADGTFVEDAGTTEAFDFLSNGFKLRNSSTGTNGNGYTYIYMAFAEHPFAGTSSINPVTAN